MLYEKSFKSCKPFFKLVKEYIFYNNVTFKETNLIKIN